jgi:hypothetical protein
MKRFTKFVVESIEEADLDEAVEVRHDRYLRSHGKKARDTFGGGGTWAFTHKDRGDVDYKNDKEVYHHRGKFADAKKAAQQWGKKHGHREVYVMESVESIEEGKWNYPKDITGSKPDVYWDPGNTRKREERKAHRKKIKAKAHAELMKGQKKTNEEVNPRILKSIHKDFHQYKNLSTVDVLKHHRSTKRVTGDYSAQDAGGKMGMVSDLLRQKHGDKHVDHYFGMSKSAVQKLGEEVELDEARSWFDPSDHEQFKNMTPEQKKARHDSLMKLATTHKNYDIRSFAKSAANELKSKYMKEEVELDEAVTVKKKDYSWGKMMTVHHGSSHSFPLHPEHQEKIKKLDNGQKTTFTDETRSKVTAHREGEKIHLKHQDSNTKTTIARSHFTESVELDEVSDKMLDRYRQKAFADQPSGDDGSDKYRKRKFGRDLAFAKQTGRAKVLVTKEEAELGEGSGPKEKQKQPYMDIKSPEYRAAANKKIQQMKKDQDSKPGKELLAKIAMKKEEAELDEARSWFDPSDHEQFKNMTPEQKKARHDSLMKLATTHKNYDIRSFAKSAANELKSKYMKEEAEQIDELKQPSMLQKAKYYISHGKTPKAMAKTEKDYAASKSSATLKDLRIGRSSDNTYKPGEKPRDDKSVKYGSPAHMQLRAIDRELKKRNEEVELDEVSKSTMGSYIQKAKADKKNREWRSIDKLRPGNPKGASDNEWKKAQNRDTGIKRAIKKLKNEEVELDEVSQELANRVAKKRQDQAMDLRQKAVDEPDMSKSFAHSRAANKASHKAGQTYTRMSKKTLKGMQNEEVELDEASTKIEIPKSRYDTIANMHGASGPTHGKVTRSPKGTMQYKGARHLDHDKKTDTHIVQTYSHRDHGLATIEKRTHNPSGEVKYYMHKKSTNESVELDEVHKVGDTVTYTKGGNTYKAKIKKIDTKHGQTRYELSNAGFIYASDLEESVNDMVRIGQKMLELAPKEKNDMISNAYSKLGDALTRYGTPFGPKNVADLEKKTGMNQKIIMSLIKKVQQ